MSAGNDIQVPVDALVERVKLTFDFDNQLPADVKISSVVGVTCSVYSGSDPDPQSRIIGDTTIVASPTSRYPDPTARAVVVMFGDALGGTKYLVQCNIQAEDGQRLNLYTHIPCRAVT